MGDVINGAVLPGATTPARSGMLFVSGYRCEVCKTTVTNEDCVTWVRGRRETASAPSCQRCLTPLTILYESGEADVGQVSARLLGKRAARA